MANTCLLPEKDPFMGDFSNQIGFGIGQGFDTGILLPPPVRPVPFYIMTLQYSQSELKEKTAGIGKIIQFLLPMSAKI